ncbi:Uncharacterised protein [BD1-7 clade bacterium]|uniref:Uncharacterized protein n=1 Tax=BD1-7 clade bacterium TaxID=2029982 RepID=A0A5S9PNH7_9GAMM|nr:Uncharacterised protein [BD1-7 clade bacterium]CAA0105509.1 Uncharacterised protein [BD1-7 clade bacterium]
MHHLSNRHAGICEIAEIGDADLVVISPSDPSFETIIRAWRKHQRGPLPVVYDEVIHQALIYRSLSVSEEEIPYLIKPATTSGLTALFSGRLAGLSDNPDHLEDTGNSVSSLKMILENACEQALCIEVRSKHVASLFMDVQTGVARISNSWMDGNDLSLEFKKLLAEKAAFSSRKIKPKKAAEKAQDWQYRAIGIDHLLWLVGYNSPVLGLPEGRLQIRSWPDFGRLPYTHLDLRLASHMIRGVQMADLLAHKAINADLIARFIQAAALSGGVLDTAIDTEGDSTAPVVAGIISSSRETVATDTVLIRKLLRRIFRKKAAY